MLRKGIHGLNKITLACAAIGIAAMMIFIFYDVLMRYIFPGSSTISYTLSEYYLMTAIIFLGMAYTKQVDGHARVTLFVKHFPETLKKLCDFLGNIAAAAVFGLMGWQGFLLTVRAYAQHEIYIGIYNWPMWAAYIFIAVGCAVMVLQCLLDVWDSGKRLLNKNLSAVKYSDESAL
ncbi:MAG: TRAP transporter small permease [Bacillota bacterium]